MAGQFLRFGIVGAVGFVVDAGLLHLLLIWGLGPYSGRVVSFLAAATMTWILNRSFTFRRDSPSTADPAPMHSAAMHPAGEWLAYLGVMVVGGMANYGTYAVAVAFWDPNALGPDRPWKDCRGER